MQTDVKEEVDNIDQNDNEELLILSTNEHTVWLENYFHEFVLLSLPTKRAHSRPFIIL